MASQHNQSEAVNLFPAPKPLQSLELPIPRPLPGATPASTAALREALQDSHKRWHCFVNERRFHNHTAHTVLALWYLGADSDVIKAAYAEHSRYQQPTFASPGPITKDNWTQHLGDADYYDAYLAFFTGELAALGPAGVVEEYVFSDTANFPEGNTKQVEMLSRFHDALIHPLIHVGYGFEFNLPGMIVQGLAQCAVHLARASPVIPASWFKDAQEAKPNSTPSVLNLLARVLADPEIPGLEFTDQHLQVYPISLRQFGEKLLKHVEAWSPDLSTKEGLRSTLEEVVWFVTLIYAVPGLTSKEQGLFNADFFHMHLVTSSMFLSSLLLHLKPKSQELLLRSYVGVCLVLFVGRGKPQLDVETFFQETAALKSLTTTTSTPLTGPMLDIPATSASSPNPWTQIIQEAIISPDDHLPKLQRTLSHYAQTYGNREAGYFKDRELKGAEKIDGTLFVRAANLAAFRLNRKTNGVAASWDMRGFYQN